MSNDELRKFGPKTSGHFSVGELCPACQDPFAVGDFTALIPLGPGEDAEQQRTAREGRAYDAVAVEVHWACATGDPS